MSHKSFRISILHLHVEFPYEALRLPRPDPSVPIVAVCARVLQALHPHPQAIVSEYTRAAQGLSRGPLPAIEPARRSSRLRPGSPRGALRSGAGPLGVGPPRRSPRRRSEPTTRGRRLERHARPAGWPSFSLGSRRSSRPRHRTATIEGSPAHPLGAPARPALRQSPGSRSYGRRSTPTGGEEGLTSYGGRKKIEKAINAGIADIEVSSDSCHFASV